MNTIRINNLKINKIKQLFMKIFDNIKKIKKLICKNIIK